MTRIFRCNLVATLCALTPMVVRAQTTAPAEVKKPYELVADFSLASSQGNQRVTTMSLGEKYTYQFNRWKLAQTLAALTGTANGEKNAELYQGSLRADIKIVDRLTGYLQLKGLRNVPSGIKSQTEEGAGLAYEVLHSPTDKMQLSAGVGSLQRKYVEGEDEQSFVGNLGLEYRHTFTKTAYFEQLAEYSPDFTTPEGWLFMSKSSLVAPISAKLGIKVSYLVNYNNLPPFMPPRNGVPQTERFKKFDGLLTTGIQFTY